VSDRGEPPAARAVVADHHHVRTILGALQLHRRRGLVRSTLEHGVE
jgi:hypothetical protein